MSAKGRNAKKFHPSRARESGATNGWLPAVLVAVGGLLLLAAFAFWRNNANGPSTPFTPEAKDVPRLKADRQQVDLGDVKLGQVARASFQIANTGDQPLQFTQAPFIEVVEGC